MSVSMTDVAYQILEESTEPISFVTLWQQVCLKMAFIEKDEANKMSQFFTNLSLDNRFAQINNLWDIRSRHKLEEVTINLAALAIEDDDEYFLEEEEKPYSDTVEEEEE